ncbi:methyltransferase type 12 [Frigidibacter sp. RF13]|uniref:class I SAM-dependent methyltransferase n=1 Tax=Frigidibacter sp. RF13 TaxID=2997340 RepID=UPI00226FD1D2|nr:methyltransferase type 12 [Frigidibacter sp. RF13]MCY1125509.1 methyltransferase type 12 [Frigidibacter sp. RF13]
MLADKTLFLRRLIRNPKQVSAIAPSSRFLGRAMARGLGPETGRVVEFGPGTGSLTRAILAAGVASADLTLFELDQTFTTALSAAFPGVRVLNQPADRAHDHVAPGVGAVVSGLPLLSMPAPVSRAIVASAFRILAPGAPYIQFTYGPKPSVPAAVIEEFGLSVEQTAFVWANLPPARVHRFFQK